jgi:hypothetical protein
LELEVINAAITLDRNKPNSVFHPEGISVGIHGRRGCRRCRQDRFV